MISVSLHRQQVLYMSSTEGSWLATMTSIRLADLMTLPSTDFIIVLVLWLGKQRRGLSMQPCGTLELSVTWLFKG